MSPTLRPVEVAVDRESPEPDDEALLRSSLLSRHFGGLIGGIDADGHCVLDHLETANLDSNSRDLVVQDLHATLVWTLIRAARETEARAPKWEGPVGQAQGLWTSWNDSICSILRRCRVSRLSAHRQHWTYAGTLLTALASVCVVLGATLPSKHAIGVAAIVFLMRLLGSLFMGPSDVTWVDTGRPQPSSLRASVIACVASHLNDALIALATAGFLLESGRVGWASAVCCALVAALLGTMARVAAERFGWEISRSPIERILRNGSVLAALTGAALVPSDGSAWFALVAAGFGLAAALDLGRVALAFKLDPEPLVKIEISVDEGNQIRMGVEGPGKFTRARRGVPVAAA